MLIIIWKQIYWGKRKLWIVNVEIQDPMTNSFIKNNKAVFKFAYKQRKTQHWQGKFKAAKTQKKPLN